MGSLSARCSVVACANPTTGHYNRSRTILENIRVSNAILSRFDMVFLLLDDPDLQRAQGGAIGAADASGRRAASNAGGCEHAA